MRTVVSPKHGFGALRRVAAVAGGQIVTVPSIRAPISGARVRVAVGANVKSPDRGVGTRCERATVRHAPALGVVETFRSTCARRARANASRSLTVEETHRRRRTSLRGTLVSARVGARVERAPRSIAARRLCATVVGKAVAAVEETGLQTRAFRFAARACIRQVEPHACCTAVLHGTRVAAARKTDVLLAHGSVRAQFGAASVRRASVTRVILTNGRIGAVRHATTTLLRQVVPGRGPWTRRCHAYVFLSVEPSILLSCLCIRALRSARSGARTARATIRRIVIPNRRRFFTRRFDTRTRSLQIETLTRSWTLLHGAAVGIHVRPAVIRARERIRAPRGLATVRGAAVRRVVKPNLSICAF